jgi:hypothetical protein
MSRTSPPRPSSASRRAFLAGAAAVAGAAALTGLDAPGAAAQEPSAPGPPVYTYDAIATHNKPDWTAVAAFCADRGMVWAPSLGPGYIDDRAVPGNTTPTLERANGTTYDEEWAYALASGNGDAPPDWVSITSFNEWHEGTMIEPATATAPGSLEYLDYEGAYGRGGRAAETAYLDRTAQWVVRFELARLRAARARRR